MLRRPVRTFALALAIVEFSCGGRVSTPEPFADEPTVVTSTESRLAVGELHVCARRRDGRVSCWGSNFGSALGTKTTRMCERPPYAPMPCSLEPVAPDGLGVVEELSLSGWSCARRVDGALCWGQGTYGVGLDAGCDGSATCAPTPVVFDGTGAVAQVAVGVVTCLRMVDGTLRCAGENKMGELGVNSAALCGRPDPTCSYRFFALAGFGDVRSVAVGGHPCAIVGSAGELWCWGPGHMGQLGSMPPDRCPPGDAGTLGCAKTPLRVPLTHIADVAVGGQFTCALTRSGHVHCFGRNTEGQLGIGKIATNPSCFDLQCSFSPVLVPDLEDVRQLAAGSDHACARLGSGAVRCWGANQSGQLGVVGPKSSNVPIEVPGLHDVVEIRAGGATSCARTRDDAIWCWGNNMAGQVGDGTTIDRFVPTRVRL